MAVLAACGGGDEYDGFDADDTGLGTPNKYLRFFNQQNGVIDNSDFTSAYHATVDPGNARATLASYISLHGLDNPDVHVIFRDTKDLGYGRDMYMRSYANTDCGGQTVAFYVRNFSVKIVEGFAYGPVNLEAAIAEDLQHHVGTNAIEFGRGRTTGGASDTCSPEPMTKFFTFEPDGTRRLRVDLDGRGTKAMPQPCITCHGGRLRPLDRNGDFVALHADDDPDQIGDVKARLQAFEVDTFEFSDTPPYRRADVEEGLRKLNAAIYCTYPGSAGYAGCAEHGGGVAAQANPGEWKGDFAREMMLGWYGGGDSLATAGSKFSDSYVPIGWRPTGGGPPVGADALFRKVIGPNCFVCHGKQGVQLGSNEDTVEGKDVDFRTWDKFISYADDIERLVYDEGRMPLGLLNYQNFWGDPQKAELLASFIAPYVTNPGGFEARRTDANGDIIMPGRVLARAGPDRVTKINAPITLDAQASLFADSYFWELVSSPTGAVVDISSPNSRKTSFSANLDGKYVLRMTASSSTFATSDEDTLIVQVDDTLGVAPRSLTFYNDISDEFSLPRTPRTCVSCHREAGGGGIVGVPMWWVADANQPIAAPPAGTPSLGLYEVAMARVVTDFIEDSLLLKKPSGQHHYGRQIEFFDTSLAVGAAGRASYDKIVNWIAEGAECGLVGPECP